MVADLAVALGAITARAAVSQVIAGTAPSRDNWAQTGGEVANAVASAASDSADRSLRAIARKIDRMPLERYAEHMNAGQRFIRMLPVEWRTDEDRRDLIREARAAFVYAAAVAEERGDVRRLVDAELALAGCWLWVPSIPDVRRDLEKIDTRLYKAVATSMYSYDPPPLELLKLYQRTHELRARFNNQKDSASIDQTAALSSCEQSFAGIRATKKKTDGQITVTVRNRRSEAVKIRGVGAAASLSAQQQPVAPRRKGVVQFSGSMRDEPIGVEVEIHGSNYQHNVRFTFWYGSPKPKPPAAKPSNPPALAGTLGLLEPDLFGVAPLTNAQRAANEVAPGSGLYAALLNPQALNPAQTPLDPDPLNCLYQLGRGDGHRTPGS